MSKNYNSNLKDFSRNLRKNMTKEERHLWYDCLKQLPVTIKRQQIIGDYIVDFYCAAKKIVIELDGTQHFECEGRSNDIIRDEYLGKLGIKVLRYSNYDIDQNFVAVCMDIRKYLLGERYA
ncbi:MAG: endonuclease domain-containing protein [Pseudobutyrivibrio sp.]|nr:endonuclease domain-containing protein [Pseudobutyrivibrio sp.]